MAKLREFLFQRVETAEPACPGPSPLVQGVAAAERRFQAYNRHRIHRFEKQVGEKSARTLRLLPLLLHVNLPGLPGYVDDPACPFGIADYSPSKADLDLARQLFPSARVRRTGILRPVVDLVAAMGSAGTIGFSGESDLDVWVCHGWASDRDPRVGLFRRKVRETEQWLAAHSGLEIHLFLQSTERIRVNDFGETDVEGCGSAMGALLKEEFYRTGIHLAGRLPFWWLTGPGLEPQAYHRAVEELARESGVDGDRFVDLGWVPRVPVGELFGAAVWQIVKGGKSPFKSALKMGLLEKAVLSDREVPPVCETLKAQVLTGDTPDPYRLLFDEVLVHYREQGDSWSEDFLARCFYLKTGIRLDPDSLERSPAGDPDRALLTGYARRWGWGPRKIRHLNDFGRWKFEWVDALAKEVDRFFLRTYKRIRGALDESGEVQRITPRDPTILGRKLQAMYREAPDKVETLHLVTRGVEESSLTLYQETLPDGDAPWRLYRGRVTPFNVDEREGALLRTSDDLLELLVWAAQNKILTARTHLACTGVEREIPAADLEALAALLAAFVADVARGEPPLSLLLESPHPVRMLVVPNLGVESEGIRELGAVHATSWGETFYRRWAGPDPFGSFLEETLTPFLLQAPEPGTLEVFAPPRKVGALRGPARRLQADLPDLASFLGRREFPEGERRRFVGAADEGFYVAERWDRDTLRHRLCRDRESLLRYLSGVGPHRRVATRVRGRDKELTVLQAVVDAATTGTVDVMLLEDPEEEMVFVVDEVGHFSHFASAPQKKPYALAKLLLFLERVFPALSAQPEGPLADRTLSEVLRIHTLSFQGTWRAVASTHEHLARVEALGLRPVGLSIERTAGEDGVPGGYRITWGDQVICSGEVASPLEEVRRRIRSARRTGLTYDAFVTHLFLDERFRTVHAGPFVTTGHYLFYKRAIEQRLSS